VKKSRFLGSRFLLVVLLGMVMVLGVSTESNASAIAFNDGFSGALIVPDQSPLDSNPLVGAVTYNGPYGLFNNWLINVTTGLTYPVFGTPASPELDLNSVNLSTAWPATLFIYFTETGFTAPGPATFQIGGTTQGSVVGNAYYDPANAQFGVTNLIGSLGAFGPGAFSGSVASNVAGNLYSLTLEVMVQHVPTTVQVTSFNADLTVAPVPVPGAVWLLGSGLLGLLGIRRRYLS
jgi:hypothetical protein